MDGALGSENGRGIVRIDRIGASALGLYLFTCAAGSAAREPRFEIGAYGGYQIGGTAEGQTSTDTLTGSIENAPSYGATLDFKLRPGAFAELSYSRQVTQIDVRTQIGAFDNQVRYDLTVQYLQIGGLTEFRIPRAEWFRPTLGGTLGATVYTSDQEGYDYEEWRPSLLLEGGAKLRFGEHLGVRLRARLLSTLITSNSALFCGTTHGCSMTVAGTAVFQGEFGAGAYVTF
jgi:hypothetical protein